MAQFDVHPLDQDDILVLDIQSNLLSHLSTRAVIPLKLSAHIKHEEIERLKPVLNIQGKDYILLTTEISYLKCKHLKPGIDNLQRERPKIIQAIDFLIQGF